jgi:hypothetical protein
MKPSDLLYDIIHSLTPEEETAFRQVASLQHGEKNYLKLFECIRSQEQYDEEAIKEKFADEVFIKHLPSEKNQLLHQLLKGLRQNYTNTNTAAYIKEQLKNVQILFNKSLYKLARRELDRVKDLAYQHELFYAILEIIDLERVIIDIEVRFGDNSMEKIKLLMHEKENILVQAETLNAYEQFYMQVSRYFERGMIIEDPNREVEIKHLLNHPLLFDIDKVDARKSKIYALVSKAIIHRLLLQLDTLSICIHAVIDLFENNESIISEMPVMYLSAHGFLTRYYTLKGQYHMTDKIIDKLEQLMFHQVYTSPDLQMQVFAKYATNKLMFLSYTGQYEKALEYIPDVTKGLKYYEERFNTDDLLFLEYTIAINYYGNNLLNKCLAHINKIINHPKGNNLKEVVRMARLLNLIIHYELNNTELLPYLYKSTLRFFTLLPSTHKYETHFLEFYKKYALAKRVTNKQELLSELEQQLREVFKNPYSAYILEYFDFFAWIDAKRHRINYSEANTIKKLLQN